MTVTINAEKKRQEAIKVCEAYLQHTAGSILDPRKKFQCIGYKVCFAKIINFNRRYNNLDQGQNLSDSYRKVQQCSKSSIELRLFYAFNIQLELSKHFATVESAVGYGAAEYDSYSSVLNEEICSQLKGWMKAEIITKAVTLLKETKDPEKALTVCNQHFAQRDNLEILTANREESTITLLKKLSVLGIFFGVGILTTGFLMAKRLYDTGGASANFFKPLTAALVNRIEHLSPQRRLENISI